MSIVGTQIDLGGHQWRVASVVREGPAWKLVLRTADGESGTMTARVEGVQPPQSLGEVRNALENPDARTFLDAAGGRWRAELMPHVQNGQMLGRLLILTSERSSERHKLRFTAVVGLAVLTDKDLRAWLEAGRAAATPAG